MTSYILLTIDHPKPIADLTDVIACQVYTILKADQDITDVTASLFDQEIEDER